MDLRSLRWLSQKQLAGVYKLPESILGNAIIASAIESKFDVKYA